MPGQAGTGAARKALVGRLRQRQDELEQSILVRVRGIADPDEAGDPAYADSLPSAVSSALEYGLTLLEDDNERLPPIPPLLLMQARLAARSKIGLDVVVRRYLAGYVLLGDLAVEAASEDGLIRSADMKRLLRQQGAQLDRLLAAIGDEYRREAAEHRHDRRDVERIERLLAGELVDTSDLTYDFSGWHLGVVAVGCELEWALRELASWLDHRLLLVHPDPETTWAWFGSRRRIRPDDSFDDISATFRQGQAVAWGEPGRGMSGWTFTHRQARSVLPLALRTKGLVRYADAGLLASALRDEVLARSLRQLYIDPLTDDRRDGSSLQQTLRAYFDADRNISSAAAALGLNRHTVTNRLREIEERLGQPLSTCAAEMVLALRLDNMAAGLSPISPQWLRE